MAQTSLKVSELVDKVERGELTLPEMQRRYVWPGTRVRDLLDSLYRGYPSGTILMWETDEDMPIRELAVRATRTPTTSQKLLLLDGQQRVTSLTAIVSGQPIHVRSKNRQKTIDILFNLEHPDGPPVDVSELEESDYTTDPEDVEDEEAVERDIQEELRKRTFVVESRALKNDPVWVPVSDIFKKDTSEILQDNGITLVNDPRYKKYSERLAKIRKIKDYSYHVEILPASMSYEEVTEIFVRVNSLGIKLRGTDLAMAQITSKWKGFMDIVEDFAKEFENDEDYIVETGLPVRLMTIFVTKQSKFKTIGRVSKDRLEGGWKKTEEGLRFAINFIRENAGIDNLAFLSSPFLIIPIAVYWVLKDGESLTPEERKRLLKWLYYAHMRGHYSMGSSETILDADLGTLFNERGLDSLINQLHLHVKKFEVDYDDLLMRSTRSPFFSMLYFVFKNKGVKDWWSGLKLSDKHTGNAHTIQYHHIFPKSLLKEYEKKEVNEIANTAFIGGKVNRAITNKEPKNYMEKIIKEQGEEALIEQLIPTDRSQWEISKYRDFLEYRRNAIADEINLFMKQYD
jgi:hypothetical protein